MSKPLFSIKMTAELSGVTEHLIRAWERRYGFLKPIRTVNQRRMFTDADVSKLKYTRFLIQKGQTIGLLATLPSQEIKKMAMSAGFTDSVIELHTAKKENFKLDLKKLNMIELDRELLRARISLPLNLFVIEVMGPLLQELGRLYAGNEISIAQEHLISFLVRNHLGEQLSRIQTMLAWQGGNRSPRMIFTTQEGNIHEFGILLSALLAGARQWPFQYLGPNLPVAEIVKHCQGVKPEILVLGSTMLPPKSTKQSLKSFLLELDQELPKAMQIWVGGYCPFNVLDIPTRRKMVQVSSLEDFDRMLVG